MRNQSAISRALGLIVGACGMSVSASAGVSEIWTMVGEATFAKIDTATSTSTKYGSSMFDPAHPAAVTTSGWSNIAITQDRTLFFVRRYIGNLHLYSVSADAVSVNGDDVVDNLVDRAELPIAGNVDGLTAGPDGNLYFSSLATTGGPATNGLYRYRVGTGATEFVGSLPGSVPGKPSTFANDLAFDPVTGDLVGSGYDPTGKLTLYRIDGASVLSGLGASFAWNSFGPAWTGFDLEASSLEDGVAFDRVTGDIFLSGYGTGVKEFDRDSAALLATYNNRNNFGYDLAGLLPVPTPGTVGLLASVAGLSMSRRRRA